MLITQQPGAIPNEILSQGDNWFIFHLLSAADLQTLRNANAHFSSDLLGSLLNEPIRGQGVFWSSAASREYPIPLRVRSFEAEFKMLDPDYNRPGVKTFATKLRERTSKFVDAAQSVGATAEPARAEGEPEVPRFRSGGGHCRHQRANRHNGAQAQRPSHAEDQNRGRKIGTI